MLPPVPRGEGGVLCFFWGRSLFSGGARKKGGVGEAAPGGGFLKPKRGRVRPPRENRGGGDHPPLPLVDRRSFFLSVCCALVFWPQRSAATRRSERGLWVVFLIRGGIRCVFETRSECVRSTVCVCACTSLVSRGYLALFFWRARVWFGKMSPALAARRRPAREGKAPRATEKIRGGGKPRGGAKHKKNPGGTRAGRHAGGRGFVISSSISVISCGISGGSHRHASKSMGVVAVAAARALLASALLLPPPCWPPWPPPPKSAAADALPPPPWPCPPLMDAWMWS